MPKVHNYSAGPCILADEVLQKAAEAVKNFNNLNLSILEVSHRGKDFVEVMENARNLVREVLNVPDGYKVLFLQGGASLGFYISAINVMKKDGKGAYIDTGAWSSKAIKEAQFLGNVDVIASSEDKGYTYIPKEYNVDPSADFLHFTSNNTIYGTQFKNIPETDLPLLCDMSSDIFSKRIDISKFDLIYAGAQKNLGPAGTTLYIVKEELLGKTGRKIPSMLDLKVQIDKDSMYNTPAVFPVYVSMLTLEWLKRNGGVGWIEKINQQKADLLYSEIERNTLFEGPVAKEDRSTMNAIFKLRDESMTDRFNGMWQAANISGIKGHRSTGGYRASMYNALPLESVQVLVDVMKEFENKA